MSHHESAEWGEWLQEGGRLLALPPLRRSDRSVHGPDDPKFALGDFLASVPPQYVEALADALDAVPAQFRVYREVAELVPPQVRVAAAWTVHRDLRSQPDLLRDGLTVREAAALMGKQPIDSKADRRLTVEERANKVRASLADPEVFAVIDGELALSRADRQLRHRARQVQSEHGQHAKALEAELRRLREAKSPFEATVKAELEVNKAIQLIEAIDQSLDDLPQAERLLGAIEELNTVVTAFLMQRRAPGSGGLAAAIVQGEVW